MDHGHSCLPFGQNGTIRAPDTEDGFPTTADEAKPECEDPAMT